MSPSLTVVVPIYNVGDYLISCLESLADQTLSDFEVLLVDDGSTDGSGAVADEFAAGRGGWRVLHVQNGGLGRARNVGLDQCSSEFVAFVDSDDLVPRDAFELMLHAVHESGSDMVCGGVLRYDGARTFSSPLHRRALKGTAMRTHVRENWALLYDTTAWNKLYRRSFLLEHSLRFAEGMYYEDIPLTVPAHFLARSVDVLTDPVYLWRERQTANQSITQRRAETRNLVDRMEAVSQVDDFLTRTGEEEGKQRHDLKVLTLDIPLFLDVLHQGDEEFQSTLVKVVADYLGRVSPATLASLVPLRRLQYHLIQRGMLAELLEVHEFQRIPRNRGRFVRSGLRLHADLPFRTDSSKAVPRTIYEVTRSQPLRTGIRDIRWQGDELVVDGHAFIHRVSEAHGLSSVRRFQIRRAGEGPDTPRRTVPARRVDRPDLTARTTAVPVSYDAAGFLARVPGSDLALGPGENEAVFELLAQVAAPAARRGSRVGHPEWGRARHPARRFISADQLAIPCFVDKALRVVVRRCLVVLSRVDVTDQAITFGVRAVAAGDVTGLALSLRRTDSLHSHVVPLQNDGRGNATGRVSADQLGVRAGSLGDRNWLIGLVQPAALGVGEDTTPLDMDPDLLDAFGEMQGRSMVVRQHGARGAVLTETRPGHILTSFTWEREGLRLSGRLNGGEPGSIRLTHRSGAEMTLPTVSAGGEWHAVLPARGEPGETVLRWLTPGRWRFAVAAHDTAQRDRPVRVAHQAELLLNQPGRVDGLTYLLRSSGPHLLELVVDGAGPWSERGALRALRNRRYYYRAQRRLPLEDTVLFVSWKGRQYSDNPRSIYEELVRRRDPRRLVWAVTHHGVEVPDGCERVVVGSRAYFRHLARARWLVSNDSMPPHYVKRSGSRYGQTWHGTPLKRIGFDMQSLQMSNQDYLKQFAVEVRKWDGLVSPNPFSTEILSRAFGYDGPVLETGYPRNDIFYRDVEREHAVAAARRRLHLPEGKRVILYAPTWRDNDFDSSGRYLFNLKLDLERMYRDLGDDSVLLIRGHQLVASAIDASMFGGFVRNVSFYPDIRELYLLADVLITDYSSVMFDFVNTGRPMLFFTWDLDAYRDDLRGFYFDFEKEAPGPLLAETTDVIRALGSLDQVRRDYADRYAAFREKFAGLEDGGASGRFIDRFLS